MWRLFRSSPDVAIDVPASVRLADLGLARHPPPHVLEMEREGIGAFDRETLFFDVFHTGIGDEIVCLGPEREGIEPHAALAFDGMDFTAPIAVRYEAPRMRQQPVGRTVLTAPGLRRLKRLRIAAGDRSVVVSPRQPGADPLAGQRVVMTLSKDNPLPWIEDWAAFHVARQGATAVLLYDNRSTRYGVAELGRTLSRVPGLRRAIVVDWPFPYGAGGTPTQPALNFCQTGMLDHARRHYCRKAASVLNLDVDELLPRKGPSIFERIERGELAAIHFRGIWVEKDGIRAHAEALALRHRDCDQAWRSQLEAIAAGRRDGLCRTKWVAVPARCGPGTEWGVHEVYAATDDARATLKSWRTTDELLHYRHFRQINAGWKSDRWRSSSPFEAVPDRDLIRNFARWTGRAK